MKEQMFVVWANNNTDSKDDEWYKVKAKSKGEARDKIYSRASTRFTIGVVMTKKEFVKAYPGYYCMAGTI